MNKTELVHEVSERTGLSLNICQKVIEETFNVIKNSLSTGVPVLIRGFGKFETTVVKERNRRDPFRKTIMVSPSKTVPVFRAYEKLSNAVKDKEGL